MEGPPSPAAKERWRRVREQLEKGWLEETIGPALEPETNEADLDTGQAALFDNLADSVTSEVGRALVGVTLAQLVIKSLEPAQSVRLHKGGRGEFSWVEGFPMRSLAADYVVPTLREKGLLRGNVYGPMMTRSMAENYPYSPFYKAAIRGARSEWIRITEGLEDGTLKPRHGLLYLISLLANRSERFTRLADEALSLVQMRVAKGITMKEAFGLISSHIQESAYPSRLLEVAMHSLVQVAAAAGDLDGSLRPLCQMRTANKKHRNVADIEITAKGTERIIEAWDAKFGHSYLGDELEELNDKLETNESVERAGFVTDSPPRTDPELEQRIGELQVIHDTKIEIVSLKGWVDGWVVRITLSQGETAAAWITAYAESLCQHRREQAPIDEPADEWVADLVRLLKGA